MKKKANPPKTPRIQPASLQRKGEAAAIQAMQDSLLSVLSPLGWSKRDLLGTLLIMVAGSIDFTTRAPREEHYAYLTKYRGQYRSLVAKIIQNATNKTGGPNV